MTEFSLQKKFQLANKLLEIWRLKPKNSNWKMSRKKTTQHLPFATSCTRERSSQRWTLV